MKLLNLAAASSLLASQGVQPASEIQLVLSGFDPAKPMYEQTFWEGDTLYQFLRLGSAGNPFITRGSWFGLAGITRQGVAVFGGLSGRVLHKYEVTLPFSALEGTAAKLPLNWQHAIGGPGGATQIYVPRMYAGRIRSLGPAEGW